MITLEECNDAHHHAKRLLEQVKQADRSVRRRTVPIYSELTPGKVVGHRLVRIDRDASDQTCELENPTTGEYPEGVPTGLESDDSPDDLCARCGRSKTKGIYSLKKKMAAQSAKYCLHCERELTGERLQNAQPKQSTTPPSASTMKSDQETPAMKTCKTCNQEKPTTEFYPNKAAKDRLSYSCKECEKEKQRQRSKAKSTATVDRAEPAADPINNGRVSHGESDGPFTAPAFDIPSIPFAIKEHERYFAPEPETGRSELESGIEMYRLFLELKPMVSVHDHGDLLKTLYVYFNK